MKVTEEFVIGESPQTLWEFFEQVERVARCVPGVEDVTVIDADNSQLRVTQALGPMTATFDVKMRITERDPGRSLQFSAVGRSVRGAAGNLRATHVVRLEEDTEGSTRVLLEGDLALGGMLGSVGQKVVAKQAAVVTEAFARALQQELSGGGEPTPTTAPRSAAENGAPPAAPPPAAAPRGGLGSDDAALKMALAAAFVLGGLLVIARRRRSR